MGSVLAEVSNMDEGDDIMQVEVDIPLDANPGDTLEVEAGGQSIEFTVPEGSVPGTTVIIEVNRLGDDEDEEEEDGDEAVGPANISHSTTDSRQDRMKEYYNAKEPRFENCSQRKILKKSLVLPVEAAASKI